MNDCPVNLCCDAGLSKETRTSLLRLGAGPPQICCPSPDAAAVVCPRPQVSSPVRLPRWLEQLMGGRLSVDSAVQHRERWGTPFPESWSRWKTVTRPAQTLGFLLDRRRETRSVRPDANCVLILQDLSEAISMSLCWGTWPQLTNKNCEKDSAWPEYSNRLTNRF